MPHDLLGDARASCPTSVNPHGQSSPGRKTAKELVNGMSSVPLSAAAGSQPPGTAHYALSSDLAQYCLPAASKDANRRLAYANSICFAFLIIGAIGLKTPRFEQRALPEVQEIVPVVFIPPPEQPVQPDTPPDQPDTPQDSPTDSPVVATVVAAYASAVAFAVPVEGPVVLAPARYAPPPPATPPRPAPAPPQPTQFRHKAGDGVTAPWPTSYPPRALEEHMTGTVLCLLVVDQAGAIVSATVKDSSGHSVLDRFATEWVKNHWHWPPAEQKERQFYVPFEFNLK